MLVSEVGSEQLPANWIFDKLSRLQPSGKEYQGFQV